MATAIYLHPASSSSEWYRRIVGSIGLDFVSTVSVGETLEQMDEKEVSLVILNSNGGYPLDDTVFPIKARHGDAKIVILSSNHAPDRVPSHIDAWICVADHEDIVRSRLMHSLDQYWAPAYSRV
jgi:hypothetical protein